MIEPRPAPGRRRPAPPSPPTPPAAPVAAAKPKAPRRWLRFVGWSFLFVMLWCGWALYALYDLSAALDNEDAVGLERRIEWVAVRQGLREDLRVMLGSSRLGELAPDRTVDPLSTQRAVVALIRSGRITDRGWDADSKPGRGFDLLRIRFAFFAGGPFTFRVDLKPDSDTVKRPLVLLFRWAGDWRLTRVFLPGDAFGNAPLQPANAQPSAPAAPATPQASAPAVPSPPAAAAAPKTAPPGSQRAVLYEEDSSDPNGKSYQGWVQWRTDPGTSGNAADAAIIGMVTLPDRPMVVTLAVHRNLDRTLPASHTIDVMFELPPDSPTRGILDVVGIMMKPNEEVSGQQLAGTRVKVSKDMFLIGLSGIELDVAQNMQVLKDRPWLGIPFVYNSSNRAVLSIEKGETGNKVISETLARWGTTPAAEAQGQKR